MKTFKIAKCIGDECEDSQTMVNFLQNKFNIKIITGLRQIGKSIFETCYYFNHVYISSKEDKSSAIILGIWQFLSDEQRLILENIAKEIEIDNKQAISSKDDYTAEKAKGGLNSYKAYKPLKKKVETLCLEILGKKPDTSALQLADQASKIIENNYKNLLENFAPYQNHKNYGTDWTNKTFYKWCNDIKKSYKS